MNQAIQTTKQDWVQVNSTNAKRTDLSSSCVREKLSEYYCVLDIDDKMRKSNTRQRAIWAGNSFYYQTI